MRTSTVPGVVRALKTLWAPVAAPLKAKVSVGPPTGDVPDKYLAIAYGGDDRPGIVGNGLPVPGMNPSDARGEEYTVWCTVSTATGDQDGLKRMDATYAVYDAAMNALLNDPHLGGAVLAPGWVEAGELEWVIEDDGGIATVFFGVRVHQEMFV